MVATVAIMLTQRLTYETLFELLSCHFTTAKQKEWIKYLYQRYVNI